MATQIRPLPGRPNTASSASSTYQIGHPAPKRPRKVPTYNVEGIGALTREQIVKRYAKYGKRDDGSIDASRAFAAYKRRRARQRFDLNDPAPQATGPGTSGPADGKPNLAATDTPDVSGPRMTPAPATRKKRGKRPLRSY